MIYSLYEENDLPIWFEPVNASPAGIITLFFNMSFQTMSDQYARDIVTLFNVRIVPCEESWKISFIKTCEGRCEFID